MNAAFTAEEQNKIAASTLQTEAFSYTSNKVDIRNYQLTKSYISTSDKVFLLSETEIDTYMSDQSSRTVVEETTSGILAATKYWWLRTPSTQIQNSSSSDGSVTIGGRPTLLPAMRIVSCSDGSVSEGSSSRVNDSCDGDVDKENYVRPALWLNYEN